MTTTAAIAVIGASAAGFATTQGKAAPASFTVGSEAVAQSAEHHRTSLEDRAYLAKAKNAGSQRAAALAEHTRSPPSPGPRRSARPRLPPAPPRIERARQRPPPRRPGPPSRLPSAVEAAARAARSQARTALAARASADPPRVARAMLGTSAGARASSAASTRSG